MTPLAKKILEAISGEDCEDALNALIFGVRAVCDEISFDAAEVLELAAEEIRKIDAQDEADAIAFVNDAATDLN